MVKKRGVFKFLVGFIPKFEHVRTRLLAPSNFLHSICILPTCCTMRSVALSWPSPLFYFLTRQPSFQKGNFRVKDFGFEVLGHCWKGGNGTNRGECFYTHCEQTNHETESSWGVHEKLPCHEANHTQEKSSN